MQNFVSAAVGMAVAVALVRGFVRRRTTELGNNGGGFFNANSAHPFENPTAWTNWVEIFLLLVISFSLPRTFCRLVDAKRQGYAIVAVMGTIAFLSVTLMSFLQLQAHGTNPTAIGAANEGMEQRFGVFDSAIFADATTLTSTGIVVWAVAMLPGLSHEAQGSITSVDGKPVGSLLIGQSFTGADGSPIPKYFQSRPSAAGNGYDPPASGASNLGPESIVDTAGDPSLPADHNGFKASLLTLVCSRSSAIGALEGVDGARLFCATVDGDGRPGSRTPRGQHARPCTGVHG